MKLSEVDITEIGKTQSQRKKEAEEKKGSPPECTMIEEEFELVEITDEQIQESRKKAEETRRLAESLGKQQVTIQGMLNGLLKKNPDWKLLDEEDIVHKEIVRLQTRLEELKNVSGGLGEHKDFAALLSEIREVNNEDDVVVVFMMNKLCQEGYYRVHAGGKPNRWPAGTIFLYNTIYLSNRNSNGVASSRTRAVEAEARKMTDAHKKCRVAKVKGGNQKIDQLVKASYAADYTLYSPPCVMPAKDDKPERERPEGWVLIRLENTNKGEKKKANWVIDILDAIGSCRWLLRGDGKKRMPHFWLLAGRPLTKRGNWMEPEAFNRTRKRIGALRGMIWNWLEEQDDDEKTKAISELLEADKNKKTKEGKS